MTRRKSRRAPTLLSLALRNAGAAVAVLLMLGAGVRTAALTTHFWQEAMGSVAAFLAVAAAVWLVAGAPSSALRRTTVQQRQRLAYGATVAGLSYVGARFWLAAEGAATWLPQVDAAVLPVLLAVALLQASLLPPRAAWDARRLGLREINLVLLLSIPALLLLPGGAASWGDAQLASPASGTGAPWLAAVTATGVALFCGQVALHALRRPGAAVMVFAAVLFFQATANFLFAQASGAANLDATAHFLAILAAVAMDAVYMIRIYAAEEAPTLWYALTAGIVMAVGVTLILLPSLAGYPAVTPAAIVGVTGGSALLGTWCGWSGARVGHRR